MVTVEEPGPVYPRFARELAEETLADTPVTVIQGARQVGKSTLARQLIVDRDAIYVSLDADATFKAAQADPHSFLRQTQGLLVIDEVQRLPELIRAVKDAVDSDRRPGRFLITGSANLLDLAGSQESLAGRAETIPLHGLSQGEIAGEREDFIDLLMTGDTRALAQRRSALTRQDYLEIVCAGSFPEARRRAGRRRRSWIQNYVNRIVSRDARDVSRLTHLDRLPALIRLLAANNSSELVKARLGAASGIPETSLPAYLELLETLYLIHRLPAWGANLTKRVTGRPKLALIDTGLAATLINVTPAALNPGVVSDAAGGLFEAFIAGELLRQQAWSQTQPELFHFRNREGLEVDLILETADRRVAGVEAKASATVGLRDFRGLTFLRETLGPRFSLGVVLYSGTEPLPFGDRLWALPHHALWL